MFSSALLQNGETKSESGVESRQQVASETYFIANKAVDGKSIKIHQAVAWLKAG